MARGGNLRRAAGNWTGDLTDDCFLHEGEYHAHVEKMDRGSWWCAIRGPGIGELNATEVTIGDECLWFTSGHDARQFCEFLIAWASTRDRAAGGGG